MRSPNFFCAIFGVVQNSLGEVLLMHRQNTGVNDGIWALPSGHVEDGEMPATACVREMEEEVGISVKAEDLDFIHCNIAP